MLIVNIVVKVRWWEESFKNGREGKEIRKWYVCVIIIIVNFDVYISYWNWVLRNFIRCNCIKREDDIFWFIRWGGFFKVLNIF